MKLYKVIKDYNDLINLKIGSCIRVEDNELWVNDARNNEWKKFRNIFNFDRVSYLFEEVHISDTPKWEVNDTVKVKDPGDRETWNHKSRLLPVTIVKIDGIFINTNKPKNKRGIEWRYTVEDPYNKAHTFQVYESEMLGGVLRYWFIRANKKIACTFIGLSRSADAFHYHTGNMYSTYEDALKAQQRILKELPNSNKIKNLMKKNME